MIVIKLNYTSVSPVIKITYDETPIYIKTSVNNVYAKVVYGSGGGEAVWGGITGTLSAQTDLQNALNAKQNSLTLTTTGSSGASTLIGSTLNIPQYSGNPGTVTSVGLSMPTAFTVSNSPITSSGTIGVTGAGTTLQYVRGDGTLATFPILATADKLIAEVYNNSGATITKGTVIYINGSHGNLPTIAKADATLDATSAQTFGLVQTDITNMNNGYVVVSGKLIDLDTQAFADGTQLYLSATAGLYTSTKQYAPIHLVYIAIVVRSHPTQGIIEVKIQNGYEVDEIHNISAQTPSNNDGLFYETSTLLWKNKSIATILGYTPEQPLTFSSPLSRSVNAISIPLATTSVNGYLSSTDWTTFNNKQNALTNPITGTGTSGQIAYWNGTNTQTGSATLTYTPTTSLLVNNSVTAASLIARGTNLTPTLVAAANNDVLVGLDIAPTFTNGAFTGVTNYGIRTSASLNNIYEAVHIRNTSTGTNNQVRIKFDNESTVSTQSGGVIFYTGNAYVGYPQNSFGFWNHTSNGVVGIATNNTERLRIFAGGNLLLQNGGTFTDGGFKLDVNGTARVSSTFKFDANIRDNRDNSVVVQSAAAISSNRDLTYGNTTYGRVMFSGKQFSFTSGTQPSLGAYGFYYNGETNTGAGAGISIYFKAQTPTATNVNGGDFIIELPSGTGTGRSGAVIIGGTSPNASAITQIDSTTRGFLPPRMTSTQRTAIATPAEGLIVFQTDGTIGLYVYANSTWRTLAMV